MSIKRIFIVISAIFAASAVFADNSSVTSKKYVDDLMSGYQGKLPGSGANTLMIYDDETGIGEKSIETTLGSGATGVPTVSAVKTGLDGKQDTITGTAGYVMTGTGTPGEVGERAIYSANTNYSNALVTAETVNTGVINAVNSSLIRVNATGAQDPNGTLWEIQDDLVALNICSDYATATGDVIQNGTPTPTNPILPTFYQDGDMILRAVGDYADTYSASTQAVSRKIKEVVLTGKEVWSIYGGEYFSRGYSDRVLGPNTPVLCTHYPNDASAPKYVSANGTNRIIFSDSRFENIEDFTAWLAEQYAAGTPVTIYYPLATETTENMPPRCQ